MKNFLLKVTKTLPFLGIIAAGVVAYQLLAHAAEKPTREQKDEKAQIVEVTTAIYSDKHVTITALGTVTPSRSVILVPEVSGKVGYCAQKLRPGGRFDKGETVLRINPRQYDLALEQQRASVAQAQLELSLENGRKAVAEREWRLMEDEIETTDEGKALALREVQLGVARASVAAAKSNLDIAKMNRNRTVIKAPFNALVTEEDIDEGQVVGPGHQLAILVDVDTYWVRVSIPVHQLPWIDIPQDAGVKGSPVVIEQEISDEVSAIFEGHVIQLLGGVDPRGQMTELLIEVSSPMEPSRMTGNSQPFPLLLNATVTTQITGPKLEKVVEIPRHAIHSDDTVLVLNSASKLNIKTVSVLWTFDQTAFVRGDIEPNEAVIVSHIDIPVEGMDLRVEEDPQS